MTFRTSRLYLRALQGIYDLVYVVGLLVGAPFVLVMLIASRRWRAGLFQRFGFCPERKGDRAAIWIHGVSVGEVLAAKELVTLIEREMPWIEVVVSTTTRTAHVAARRAYEGHLVFYYPLDFSFATRRVVDRIRPSVVLLMELELWPNFLLTTSLRGIPVLLANGRMSDKSARDYLRLQRVIPEPMHRVMHYCVQEEQYARRFLSVGVPADRITITGSMKFDTIADDLPESVRADYMRRLAIANDAFVLIAGSTHAGEEEIILDAFLEIRARDPGARLIVVPRFPERVAEVEQLVRQRGLQSVRLSTLRADVPQAPEVADSVVLGDTLYELRKLYVVADLVFVGGTLTRRGGQNMMEPAGLSKAVVVGPATWNFRDPVELLLARGGLTQMKNAEGVRRELVSLHGDPERRRLLGEHAREVCRESKGATRRILDILRSYVPARVPEVSP